MVLSIIIPVFNKESYLSRCFDSILKQINGLENQFEILVIDDGSTDHSGDIIQSYALNNRLFSVYSQPNSGVSAARNVGIENAQGKYILFLDADDEIIDGSLSKIADYLNSHENIDMLVTRQTRVINGDEYLINISNIKEDYKYTGITAYQAGYIRTNAGGGICRKSFLNNYQLRFPLGVKNAEDTIFFGLVQLYSESLVFLNIPLYRINVLKGSTSRVDETALALRHVDTINAINNIRNRINCNDDQKGIIEFLTYQLISNAIGHFILSENLTYKIAKKMIKSQTILPLNTRHMCMMKGKARIMNLSFMLFYFLNYLKCKL